MLEADFHGAIGDFTEAMPHARFGVYRNNVESALVNALRVRFPATEYLLGPGSFKAVASRFALEHLPQSAVLIGYGAAFPGHLADPAIADVAEVENRWWQAYHAAEALPMPPSGLQEIAPEDLAAVRFVFHPSVSLFTSPTGAGSRWRAAKDGQPSAAGGLEHLLIARPGADVIVTLISGPSQEFIAMLVEGDSLGQAAEAWLTRHPQLDLQQEIAGLLAHRIIIGVQRA